MKQDTFPVPQSLTHVHLAACIMTSLKNNAKVDVVRICDIGFGGGEFISYLYDSLTIMCPDQKFELYGFDVDDSGVQASGFYNKTIQKLADRHPTVPWQERLFLIGGNSKWPFPNGYFNITCSNQVVEHVDDHLFFFKEQRRVLCRGGTGVHLFPLKHYLKEGHIHIPLAHRVHQHAFLRSYIGFWSRLGIGSFAEHRDKFGMSLDHYAEEHADYLSFMTNYLSAQQLLELCRKAKLRADFRYTSQFFYTKLRQLLNREISRSYRPSLSKSDLLLFWLFKRISSITLLVENQNIYKR
jgi:SAM-dependent methyltransferase